MRNPFKKQEENKKIEPFGPQTDEFGNATTLLSVNSLYKIENHTLNPDQLLSITTMLMDYSASIISSFSETDSSEYNGKAFKYEEIIAKLVQGTQMYKLVDAGMSPKEASDVVGLEAVVYEIPKG